MSKELDEDKKMIEEIDPMVEMANIRKDISGLPVNIWASVKYGHKGLRLEVSREYGNRFDEQNSFSLYFDGDEIKTTGNFVLKVGEIKSKDVNLVAEFFKKHKPSFQLYWDRQIDDTDLRELLAKNKAVI